MQYHPQIVLPECYEEEGVDGCPLHISSESEITAVDFRPYYTADGQYMECTAHIDHVEPEEAKLYISMKCK